MKIINGLLSNPTSKEFLDFKEAFDKVNELYPNYSMFIEYLRLRYYDSYDFSLFLNAVSETDKTNNTATYLRKEKEYPEMIKKMYGPFYSGREKDDLSKLIKKEKIEIIKYIIDSSSLDNDVFKKLMDKAHYDSVYDFYNSLYLQKMEKPDLKYIDINQRAETDLEYIIWNYMLLRHEQNNKDIEDIFSFKDNWQNRLIEYKKDEIIDENEPDEIEKIMKLCSFSNEKYEVTDYKNKLFGAVIARFAGCMLGAPVENWSIEKMKELAKNTNTTFPPTDYWNDVLDKEGLHYKKDKKHGFAKDKMCCVIADDDVTYTVLNALIMKKYGIDFSSNQACEFWYDHIPYACTAEYETMIGIRNHKHYKEIVKNNPYIELIGAAIRADAFGYVCPGNPHKAALLAYKDACITHRRNGIYGEMFLSAAIALAFCVNDPLIAIKKALDYIPDKCRLKKDVLWALDNNPKDYLEAASLISLRFPYMNRVHTNNNMCAIIFSFKLGKNNFDAVISNCIAMGYDNDCTGASVGSIFGACYGINSIDEKWYKNFNNEIHTYIRGYESLKITEYVDLIMEINKNA